MGAVTATDKHVALGGFLSFVYKMGRRRPSLGRAGNEALLGDGAAADCVGWEPPAVGRSRAICPGRVRLEPLDLRDRNGFTEAVL